MDERKIMNLSIKEVQYAVKEGNISCEEITKAYLEQIRRLDPDIRSYLHLNESAEEEARALDRRIAAGENIGTLVGVPVALQDNIVTSDMPTSCASKMLEGYRSPFDATVVKQLKKAGAIILGKLNMAEFGMGISTEISNQKVSKNPYNQSRISGPNAVGSVIAAKESLLAVGSDTGGELRKSCGFCGAIGIKPTYGAVSRNGLIAGASSMDQIGPCAGSVEDVAEALNVLVAYDKADSTCVNFEKPDYIQALDRGIDKMKIALPRSFFDAESDPLVSQSILRAAENFEKLGVLVEEVDIPNLEYALSAHYILSCAEASSNMARFDGLCYGHRTKDYIDFEELYKKSRWEGFGSEVKQRIFLGSYVVSAGYYDLYYKKAQKVRRLVKEAQEEILKDYDLILMPVSPCTALEIGVSQEAIRDAKTDIYTSLANMSGLPALSMNCGYDQDGMPIGMQLIGAAFKEEKMLRLAYRYEQMI